MPTTSITQVVCYLTDCLIPTDEAERLTITDGQAKSDVIQVFAHRDVLKFQAKLGLIHQTDQGNFLAIV